MAVLGGAAVFFGSRRLPGDSKKKSGCAAVCVGVKHMAGSRLASEPVVPELPAEGLELSCGAEVDFGDCYASVAVCRRVSVRNLSQERVDVQLSSDKPGQVAFELVSDWSAEPTAASHGSDAGDSASGSDADSDGGTGHGDASNAPHDRFHSPFLTRTPSHLRLSSMAPTGRVSPAPAALPAEGSALPALLSPMTLHANVANVVARAAELGAGAGSSAAGRAKTPTESTSTRLPLPGAEPRTAPTAGLKPPLAVPPLSLPKPQSSLRDAAADTTGGAGDLNLTAIDAATAPIVRASGGERKNCVEEVSLNPGQRRFLHVWITPATSRQRGLPAGSAGGGERHWMGLLWEAATPAP